MEKLNCGAIFTESETEFCQRCGLPVRYVAFAAAKRPIRIACECRMKEQCCGLFATSRKQSPSLRPIK